MKISKDSSAKYYQRKLVKDIKTFPKNKKKKRDYMVVTNLLENEKQKLLEYRKKYYKTRKKCLITTKIIMKILF